MVSAAGGGGCGPTKLSVTPNNLLLDLRVLPDGDDVLVSVAPEAKERVAVVDNDGARAERDGVARRDPPRHDPRPRRQPRRRQLGAPPQRNGRRRAVGGARAALHSCCAAEELGNVRAEEVAAPEVPVGKGGDAQTRSHAGCMGSRSTRAGAEQLVWPRRARVRWRFTQKLGPCKPARKVRGPWAALAPLVGDPFVDFRRRPAAAEPDDDKF